MPDTQMRPRRLLRRATVKEITSFSDSELDRRVKEGRFVSPIRLGPRTVVWDSDAVEAWLASVLNGGGQ
ncbi:transcriptional regulator [Pandoraea horticolens]|uniref:Transcriptional regulator n=1 Tax=Pandoraea horticolens TaxID=2508298 RepID=A0A5E4VWS2_9BURK|nr:transcriptional regulator [Pandoraea horticolens]